MNTTNKSDNPAARRVVEEAAAWLARHRLGALSDDDAAAFRLWLNAAPAHSRAWRDQERLWTRVGEVRDAPAILALRESTRTQSRQRRAQRLTWQWGSALAATFLVGVMIWHWQPQGNAVMRADASSALLVADDGQLSPLAPVSDVSTRIGERALVQLADGSVVTLNTDSAIHVDLAGAKRQVTLLRGHAYFEVAKDEQRPFVVSAGMHQVVALGTAFDVRLQAQQVKVNLVEGKVRVERVRAVEAGVVADIASPVILEAGSSLVARADGEQQVQPLDVEREVSWRTGKLVFESDRLADVVAEMNLYSTQKIEILDAVIRDELLSGVFDPAGGAELARALESYGMVRIVGQDSSAIVLGAPEKD